MFLPQFLFLYSACTVSLYVILSCCRLFLSILQERGLLEISANVLTTHQHKLREQPFLLDLVEEAQGGISVAQMGQMPTPKPVTVAGGM